MTRSGTGTFNETWKAMVGAIQAAYQLAPLLVVMLIIVIGGVATLAVTSTTLMTGIVLLIVLLVTVVVFATTSNFGEAALALVAGVLTAYSVAWTPAKFIAFVAVWSGFSLIAIMIASIKIAARSESIYRQAAIALSDRDLETAEAEKQLQAIASDRLTEGLGPIERAEVLRLFAFRKLPMDAMHDALHAVAILSVITQIDHMKVAVFVADAVKVFESRTAASQSELTDLLYQSIKDSAVPPADFIVGFESARHLILSGTIEPLAFLEQLRRALEVGVKPESVAEAIVQAVRPGDGAG
jgi:hypothetical protein